MPGSTSGTGHEKQPRGYVREFTVRRKDLEALDRPPTEGELYPPELFEFALFGRTSGAPAQGASGEVWPGPNKEGDA